MRLHKKNDYKHVLMAIVTGFLINYRHFIVEKYSEMMAEL